MASNVLTLLGNIDLVQQGISEKVALVVHHLASFATGFILAYARNWRLALAMSSVLPCMAFAGAWMEKVTAKYMQYVAMSLPMIWIRFLPLNR
jgi:ABC-type multidrug transport system fused ATPase/permease subunit